MQRRYFFYLLDHCWKYLKFFSVVCILLMGLLIAIVSIILPYDHLYKNSIEQYLSGKWNMQVTIEQLDGSWNGYGPVFNLNNLTLSGEQQVFIKAVRLSLNVYELLWPGGQSGFELVVKQADASLVREVSNGIVKATDSKGYNYSDILEHLLNNARLKVENLNLSFYENETATILDNLHTEFLVEEKRGSRRLRLALKEKKLGDGVELRAISGKERAISQQADWYLNVNNLSLLKLGEIFGQDYLPDWGIKGESWFDTSKGMVKHVQGEFLITDNLENEKADFRSNLLFEHNGDEKQWQLTAVLKNLVYRQSPLSDIEMSVVRDQDYIVLQLPLLSAKHLELLGSFLPDNIDISQFQNIQGQFNNVRILYDLDKQEISMVDSQFENFALINQRMALHGVSGSLRYVSPEQFSVLIDSKNGWLEMPQSFRGKVQWRRLVSQVDVPIDSFPDGLQVSSLWCDCIDFMLDGQAYWKQDEDKYLDFFGHVTDVDISQLYKYWPYKVWKPDAIKWLDDALRSGKVKKGMIAYIGAVGDKVFSQKKAQFLSRAYVNDAKVKYHPDWPIVQKLNAVADFVDQGVSVNVNSADVLGNQVNHVEAGINHYNDGYLQASIEAESYGESLINFMNQSPILKKNQAENIFDMSGHQHISLELIVPYRSKSARKMHKKGAIVFNETLFTTDDLQLSDIKGPVELADDYLDFSNLEAILLEEPVKLGGGIHLSEQLMPVIDVNFFGHFAIETLMQRREFSLPLAGRSNWHFNIHNTSGKMKVRAKSDLKGVSSALPAPLGKSKNSPLSLEIQCQLPCADTPIHIDYDSVMNTVFTWADKKMLVSKLLFGSDGSNGVINFGGHISQLNVDDWLGFINNAVVSENGFSSQLLNMVDEKVILHIDEVVFMSRVFVDVAVSLKLSRNGVIVELESESIVGTINIPDEISAKGIIIDLKRLKWSDIDPQYVTADSASAYSIPDLHIRVDDFYYGNISLGRLRMESRQVADGIKIEQLSTVSELMSLHVSGNWSAYQSDSKGLSDFEIVMVSDDIAAFMNHIGVSAPISSAQIIVTMDVSWRGLPSQFDLSDIYGNLNIKIGSGEVIDSKPGIGRVLGLFSLTSLPRRLLLDFRDVIAEGLHFESMQGDFNLGEGTAVTENFLIRASSAEIVITGSTGFVTQDYDQLISVRPQVGKTFPTIGAIAGGAVGAAAGFVVQGLFKRMLNKSTEIQYRVTGSWSDPVIVLLEEE